MNVFAHPTYTSVLLNYNGGFYAQDSWTIDRLTLNYGLRADFAAVSVPSTPKGQGRFVGSYVLTGRDASELPGFGPDFAPRFSAVYDVFGDARTALKFGVEQVHARRRRRSAKPLLLRGEHQRHARLVRLPT